MNAPALKVALTGYAHNKRGVFIYTDNGNSTDAYDAMVNALAFAHPIPATSSARSPLPSTSKGKLTIADGRLRFFLKLRSAADRVFSAPGSPSNTGAASRDMRLDQRALFLGMVKN